MRQTHPLDAATIVDALTVGGPADDLALRVVEARRVAALFDHPRLTPARLEFLRTHLMLIDPHATGSLAAPTVDIQLRVEAYRRLVERWETGPVGADALDEGLAALMDGGPASEAKLLALARAFGCHRGTMMAICERVPSISSHVLDTFCAYDKAHELALDLRVDISTVADLVGWDEAARTAAVARLDTAVELGEGPAWLIKRRDALVTLLTRSPATPYGDADDLYAALLIDVEVSPCVETTRVASAIDAIQTYAHRVRMSLEVSAPGAIEPIAIPPSALPADQWVWRRSYRVWEANRRVFLYPENYLEPGVRDDKTPLFEAFEETLSSRDLSETAIEDAYARYLRGFEEVGRLRIGGAYHQKGEDSDVMHLFGVDSQDPPNWYYRRVEDLTAGVTRPERGTRWSYWTPLDLKIPVRDVSPIVYRGRLHVFWVQIATRAFSSEVDNEFAGYLHDVQVYFAVLRPDGAWSAPQRVELASYPRPWRPGIIEDRLDDQDVPRHDIGSAPREAHREPPKATRWSSPSGGGSTCTSTMMMRS